MVLLWVLFCRYFVYNEYIDIVIDDVIYVNREIISFDFYNLVCYYVWNVYNKIDMWIDMGI